tara:strand:+ start:2453 stop:3184 length:732 start_codon:yes stop_codon:yes gene_type:complete
MRVSSNGYFYLSGNKLVHYCSIVFLLLITLYGLFSAFNRGTANGWYFNAEFALNDRSQESAITELADYQQTLLSIKKAQSLDINHPHYAHMLGRIMHLGVDLGFENKAKLEEVRQLYLLSTKLRPLWPDPWVDLFRLNNYLYGYNEQTKYFIKQALLTGPYVDLVTIGTIQVWLLNWALLTGEERALLFNQFAIATQQNKVLERVLEFSKSINREKLLCSQLQFNSQYLKQKKSYLFRRYCLN